MIVYGIFKLFFFFTVGTADSTEWLRLEGTTYRHNLLQPHARSTVS